MFRLTPLWYKDGLAEIVQKFSSEMASRRSNVLMMPSFPSPVLEADGVHLTPLAGMEFVLHLFDAAREVISRSDLDSEEKIPVVDEGSRVLGDRLMVLEQDNRHLASRFDLKYAIDAEMSDFQENLRNESFVMVQGLPRLPKLEPKEWQNRARSDVSAILTKLMGSEVQVLYVQNSTGRGRDAKVLYRVKLESAEVSKAIRGKFGYFFSGKKDSRPAEFSSISIRNCVTTATLARLAILQLLGKRYSTSNPGSTVQVIGYEPRPLLKITPPADSSDRRTMVFTFIDAVQKLPTSFSPSEISSLMKRISPKLFGNLRALLVVVNDDMLSRKPRSQRGARSESSSAAARTEDPHESNESGSSTESDSEPSPPDVPSGSRSRKRAARDQPGSGSSRHAKARK